MCRNIRTLFNLEPPVKDEEIRVAALQFVRKISGFSKPSKANEAAFLAAVDAVESASRTLMNSLETNAAPKSRETLNNTESWTTKPAIRDGDNLGHQ